MRIINQEHLFVRPPEPPYSVIEARRFYGCDMDVIASKGFFGLISDKILGADVVSRMGAITNNSGFTLKSAKVIRFGKGNGITVAQLLAESASDMHTYPECWRCAHLWLDYCSWKRDNTDLAERWWDGNIKLLKPDLMIIYPAIYLPVHAPRL